MTVALGCVVQSADVIISMQIQQKALQLRNDALLRDMYLGEAVDGLYPRLDLNQLLRLDQVRLVDDNDVRV